MTVERSLGERRANPFSRELARANSSRAVFRGKKLVRTPLGEPATPLQEFVHDSFRALVLNPAFSCVGAKSAVQRGSYNFGLYAEMDSLGSTAGLTRDLFDFVEEQEDWDGEFSTFIACFEGPVGLDEEEFEWLLWAQLQRLHEEDRHHHSWDASVSPDPGDPQFAFSRERDQATLAALIVTSLGRLGRRAEAERFHREAASQDFAEGTPCQ